MKQIVIYRKKSTIGQLANYKVYINKKLIGKLRNDDKIIYKHNSNDEILLEIKSLGHFSKNETFIPGELDLFETSYSLSDGNFFILGFITFILLVSYFVFHFIFISYIMVVISSIIAFLSTFIYLKRKSNIDL